MNHAQDARATTSEADNSAWRSEPWIYSGPFYKRISLLIGEGIYYKTAGLVRLRRKTMRKMTLSKSILRRAFVLLALLSAISTARGSRPETTTKIDVPGAVVTVASGINGDGAIVGWYCLLQPCTAARFHGFMLKDDVRTYIDVPNSSDHPAIGTQPRYISPQGVVIGAYLTGRWCNSGQSEIPRLCLV